MASSIVNAPDCYCGSGLAGDDCCLPIIYGDKVARTAEQLLRSRFTASVLANGSYLRRTWHPDHRPARSAEALSAQASAVPWLRLEVLRARGGPNDKRGKVECRVWYLENGVERAHHERSRFERKGGRWLYTCADKMRSQ